MTGVVDHAGPHTGELLDGRYILRERIGEGATAQVYRADDAVLHRTVAIKLLRGPFEDVAAAERARSETRLLASLNHHSLVTLFDARISSEDVSYLAMEFVDGMTLRDLIARGPVDAAQCASLALDLAEGLHVAHTAGVVHRDLKPSNVLIWQGALPTGRLHAKLADFGIAYLLDSARLTTPGLVVGTMAYIAPEQARGAAPAPSADIYAFGILLIEALTGERPFSDFEGIGSVVARLQKPPEIPEHLSPEWQGVLRGMTALRPEDRPTALEVAAVASQMIATSTAPSAAESTAELSTALLAPPLAATVPLASTPTGATLAFPAEQSAAGGGQPAAATGALRTREPVARRSRRPLAIIIAVLGSAAVVAAAIALAGLPASAPAPTTSKSAVVQSSPHPTSRATTAGSAPTSTAPASTAPASTVPVSTQPSTGGKPGGTDKGPGKGNDKGPGKGKGGGKNK